MNKFVDEIDHHFSDCRFFRTQVLTNAFKDPCNKYTMRFVVQL